LRLASDACVSRFVVCGLGSLVLSAVDAEMARLVRPIDVVDLLEVALLSVERHWG
jgi:hypothetical protein